MMIEHKLSDKYSIWIGRYTRKYDQKDFLNAVKLNESFSIPNNNNSIWVEINNRAFNSVNEQVKRFLESNVNRKFDNYAEHYWIYTQTKGFDLTWMHQHLLVHPGERSHISTDYTFTCYIQTPKDIQGDEGHIVFEDENKTRHKFLPQEGDIFIFPADLRHTAIPTPKSEIDRIVYAGSICLDIHNQTIYKKSIL